MIITENSLIIKSLKKTNHTLNNKMITNRITKIINA